MNRRILPLPALCLLLSLSCVNPAISQSVGNKPASLEGIKISFESSPEIFPESWLDPTIAATASPMALDERERSQSALYEAARLYPANLLKKNLKSVFLVADLRFSGVRAGGTNSLDALYLCNNGYMEGFTDQYLRESFHHEFSSILYRNYKRQFPEAEWLKCNPKGFKYGSGGVDAVKAGVTGEFDPAMHSQGFLGPYAKASIEEDINLVAGGMLSGRPNFWPAIDKNPKLRKKCDLLLKFYRGLAPSFTEKSLRKLAHKPAR